MTQSAKLVALVTGASSGMGKDIAGRLLDAGYEVYAGARRLDLKADLERAGAQVLALVGCGNSASGAEDNLIRCHG